MIVSLGGVFNLNITESAAKSILASAAATVTGRTVSQFLVGWIPVIGNAINTATAAGVTEAIGWLAANNFYQRYLQDMEKGRYEGAKVGYKEASDEYERKMRQQADDFIKQRKDFEKERNAYEELIKEYEAYIDKLERERAAYEHIADLKREYRKGADGKPEIIPEQAEIIRLIFNSYLQGDSLQSIKAKLETAGALTARGNTAWSAQSIQRILQNEKYCGDVLLQKTFTEDVLTGVHKKNTGQLPQYYIENYHEGILAF